MNQDIYTPGELRIIKQANTIMERRMREYDVTLRAPEQTRRYLRNKIGDHPHEVFCALWLNNRHQVIEFEELFKGTIDGAAVYPREVVKAGLAHNAAAVIFCHNHPSGITEPSQADLTLTRRLKEALALIDIRLLDHIIVGPTREMTSLAELGEI